MTREEAIEILQGAIKKPNTKDGYLGQAIDMAIKALEQETTIQERQAESDRWQKAFDDGYQNGYSQASFDCRQDLDKIRDEISCNIIEDDISGNTPAKLRADWAAANKAHMMDIAIIDKYRAESEDT